MLEVTAGLVAQQARVENERSLHRSAGQDGIQIPPDRFDLREFRHLAGLHAELAQRHLSRLLLRLLLGPTFPRAQDVASNIDGRGERLFVV